MKETLSYPLDNAALLYPSIISRQSPMLYRFAASLKETVHVEPLQRALENILPRFPIMRTMLRSGFFWYYLEESFKRPVVRKDDYPCFLYNLKRRKRYPFRVRAYGTRIALETSHLVTDGRGAMVFFKALLAEYFTQRGYKFKDYGDIIRPASPFHIEEIEDAYKSIIEAAATPVARLKGQAFREPGKIQKAPFFKIMRFILPLDAILAAAKMRGASLTEFLIAVYAAAHQDRMFLLPPGPGKNRRPIRITTPVDLHSFFPSKSLRNFIGLIHTEIDPRIGIFSFDEILNEVHHTMRKELVAKRFQPFIGRNVRSEQAVFLAGMPHFIKSLALRTIHADAMRHETSVLSNLGKVILPEEIGSLIENIEFIPAAKPINRRDCAVISYKDRLTITFSRVCENDEVERYFFDRLNDLGLKAQVEYIHAMRP